MCYIFLSVLIGLISWHGDICFLTITPLTSLLWSKAKNKAHSYIIVLCYYISSSYGLIKGSGVFFTPKTDNFNFVAALTCWIAPALILSIPWAILFSKNKSLWRLPLIIVIISLPPIGLVGFASPLTAAGVLFPNAGFTGIVAIIILMIVLTDPSKSSSKLILSILLTISIILNINYEKPSIPKGWVSINTNYSRIKNEHSQHYQSKDLILKITKLINESNDLKLILLPELVIDNWNDTSKHLWQNIINQAREKNIIILLGTKINLNDQEYLTGLVNITSETIFNSTLESEFNIVTSQNPQILVDRVPVPISMWNPFANKLATNKPTAKSYWLDPGVYLIPDKHRQISNSTIQTTETTKITTLICYEQLLIWPILHSMIYKPKIILASSNVWWARNTDIPNIQNQALKAWSRLFKVPVLSAVNN